ncbi:Citrate lyase subunit beta-like protein, mitochondrial [Liparis tanakae]|uniref:Citrate lyase subunit beta-like protein, mitochondrial n=1 Tax=Liparis tanakae TaxID=230148 RepID=A0A4Z2HV86_9TELE|nr:Citrate lyase subunit beta-like protein, mitochondrial [Liparis tanakae]
MSSSKAQASNGCVEQRGHFVGRFQHHLKGRRLTEPIRLVTFVETAVGLLNFQAVCEEVRRLAPEAGLHHDGVVFGSDDFCASIGATRTEDAGQLLYARQKVVVTAKAFGLQAVDMVHIDYRDVAGLRRQAREGALMGFTALYELIQELFLALSDNTVRPKASTCAVMDRGAH